MTRLLSNAWRPIAMWQRSSGTFAGIATVRQRPAILTKIPKANLRSILTETTQRTHEPNLSKYRIQEQPLGKLDPLRVIIIGAGINGLNMLYTLQKQTARVSYVVYEKNSEVGGTWYENRYPGCASDDPSHNYQFKHTLNPSWSSVFAPAREIKQYLNDFTDKHQLRNNIKCGFSVSGATWDEESSEWVVRMTEGGSDRHLEDRAQILVDATGIFNDYKWPEIEGLQSFEGGLVHTANWPSNFSHHGKTIAVMGNGASGVQLVPAIQQDVKKMLHFIRSKTWIAPPSKAVSFCQQFTIDSSNGQFNKEWMNRLVESPDEYAGFLDNIDYLARKERFKTILNASHEAQSSQKTITEYMTKELKGDAELIKKLIPTAPVGCRRITGSTTYLRSLCEPNVEVMNKSIIQTVTPTGILLDSGEHHELDAIICATGFNTSFIPRFPIIGDSGQNLQVVWRQENGGPRAYMSIMAEGMPNYFRLLGPNGPLAHGAIPRLSCNLCTYVLRHIQKLQLEHISSVRPISAAVQDFNEHVQAFMPRTAWAGHNCGGWYKAAKPGGEGRVTALHPGSQTHWEKMLDRVRWEDFEFRREGHRGEQANRFEYLGNGFAIEELESNE